MTNETLSYVALAVGVAGAVVAMAVAANYRHQFIVNDGYAGLLYPEGQISETLLPGRHVRWGRNYRLALVDQRKTLIAVAGQEVLTADNVGVKLSLVLTTQVNDAVRSVQSADNWSAHVYSAAQTAMRNIVAGFTMDALLAQRVAIGDQLRATLAPQAEALGVQLHVAEVRDVMLPGDLRKAFAETLKAKQEGLAALERARGESAALRNLANSARLLESHPGLATLRFLQTLEASQSGQTIVMNDLAAILPSLRSRGRESTEPESSDS